MPIHVAMRCTKLFIHIVIAVHTTSVQSFATSFLVFAFLVLAYFKIIVGLRVKLRYHLAARSVLATGCALGFLNMFLSQSQHVCACVCASAPRALITSGVIPCVIC